MRITPRRLVGHLLCLALSSLATAASVHAATRCVAPGGAYGCLSSINIAISASAAGDVVVITDGHYAENVVIDKPLTLTGIGGGAVLMPAVSNPNPCPGEGSLCAGASNIILVQASNVVIRNLTLDGDNPALTSGVVRDGADLDARNGIITNHLTGIPYNNLTVTNVTVQNIYLRGIYASSGGTFTFDRNTVRNVQGEDASIAMFNRGGSGRMTRNTVSKAKDAISSNWSSGVQFLNNTVRQSGSGIHTDNSGGDGVGAGDVIAGNRIEDGAPGAYGIFVFVPYVPVVVRDNRIAQVEVGLSVFGQAQAVTTTFTDNVVDGRHTPGTAGVLVTTDQLGYGQNDVTAVFTRNAISGFENGFVIESDPQQTITLNASCNDIRNGQGRTVVVGGLASYTDFPGVPPVGGGTANLVFSQNNFRGKGLGVENRGPGTPNAENNWWGCDEGPGAKQCLAVVGSVSFAPWLTHRAECANRLHSQEPRE